MIDKYKTHEINDILTRYILYEYVPLLRTETKTTGYFQCKFMLCLNVLYYIL